MPEVLPANPGLVRFASRAPRGVHQHGCWPPKDATVHYKLELGGYWRAIIGGRGRGQGRGNWLVSHIANIRRLATPTCPPSPSLPVSYTDTRLVAPHCFFVLKLYEWRWWKV
jgi:hypothetical protein